MTTDYAVVPSPVGRLLIEANERAVTRIALTDGEARDSQHPVIALCVSQLREYFAGRRTSFDLPLAPQGTAFRQKVWQALRDIPYGGTASYGDVAKMIGIPGAMRAVGQANHANPVIIVIPCHRVIRADGSIGGYGGGVEVKRYLLTLEERVLRDKISGM